MAVADINVQGLPELTGKLDSQDRRRATQLEAEYDREELSFALVEREQQFADLLDRMRRNCHG
jgi:hypothetical protein